MRIIPITIIAATSIFASCSRMGSSESAPLFDSNTDKIELKEEASADLNYGANALSVAEEASSPVQQKIIKRATINIEVADYKAAKHAIDSIIGAYKAYALNENYQQEPSRLSNSLEIKVDAAKFDLLLASLAGVAKNVDNQYIETSDVTEEYIDIQAHISNKRKVERTYIRLLNSATEIEDILKIEGELGKIRSEIESIQGRLKYIEQQVQLSSISLYVYQNVKVTPSSQSFLTLGERIANGLRYGWMGIVWFVVMLFTIWPLWVIALAVFIAIKLHRRRSMLKRQRQKLDKKMDARRKKERKKESTREQAQQESDPRI